MRACHVPALAIFMALGVLQFHMYHLAFASSTTVQALGFGASVVHGND